MDNEDKMLAVPETGLAVQTRGSEIVTARKVEVRRSMERVVKNMTFLAREAGDAYYYSIPFKSKDRKTNRTYTTYVEGPSVTLTMDLAREYGNCVISCDRIIEEPNAWFFEARFTDLETGYSLVRSFRQRRDQETGMERRDPGRAQDILFQIGQSKALRNVIRNALNFMCDRVFEEAKASKLKEIEADPQRARESIVANVGRFGGDIQTIERSVGRAVKSWTAQDMAGIYGRLRAVADNQTTFEDAFAIDAGEEEAPKEKPRAKMTAAPKEEKPSAKKPKEETKDAAPKQEKSEPAAKQEISDIPEVLDRREKEEPKEEPAADGDGDPRDNDDDGWPAAGDDDGPGESVDPDTGEVTDDAGPTKDIFGDD